jgi:hypothetical protein
MNYIARLVGSTNKLTSDSVWSPSKVIHNLSQASHKFDSVLVHVQVVFQNALSDPHEIPNYVTNFTDSYSCF